jgi:hypothetical protein
MKGKKYLFFSAALCSILFLRAVPSFGAHPLLTDNTFTQGKGKTQVEASYQYNHDNDTGVKTQISQPQIQVTYGIIDPLDAIVTVPTCPCDRRREAKRQATTGSAISPFR